MYAACGISIALTFTGIGCVMAQNLGYPPKAGVNAMDIYTAFVLSSYEDNQGNPLDSTLSGLQVGERSAALGLSQQSAIQAWQAAQHLYESAAAPRRRRSSPSPSQSVIFTGSLASALNLVLARTGVSAVYVAGPALSVDQPIEINRSGLSLDLGATRFTGANPQSYMVRIENAADIRLQGGIFISGDSAILVNSSNGVDISHVEIDNLTGAGIVVTNSTGVSISSTRITGIGLAGITVHRNTTASIVQHNSISGITGASNMMAGIVLTDREVDLTSNPRALLGPGGYWVIQQPMSERMHPPHDNLIAWNDIEESSTSGIYSDGGVRNVIYGNSILESSKEGLCLDDGSTANVVASNDVEANGDRWGEPDSVLALDSVLSGGRLPDGTAAEKVPGISLDNAIFNVLFNNRITHNFGGGIKLVRTGYFNALGLNLIEDDNDGASANFHFFGIELGAAAGDTPSIELDFTPSHGNIVFSNTIVGSHYSGIFFDQGSDQNNILYNTVLDATDWALESVAQMANNSLNNLTNLPSRNISAGLNTSFSGSEGSQ